MECLFPSKAVKPAVLSTREERLFLRYGQSTSIYTEPISSMMVPATVEVDEPMGTDSLLWLKLEQQSLSVRIDVDLNCQEGTIYHLEFSIPKSSIFRKDTEERI